MQRLAENAVDERQMLVLNGIGIAFGEISRRRLVERRMEKQFGRSRFLRLVKDFHWAEADIVDAEDGRIHEIETAVEVVHLLRQIIDALNCPFVLEGILVEQLVVVLPFQCAALKIDARP